MDDITKEFINYFNDYYENDSDWTEIAGDYACKYCDNQEHVNKVLDELDEYYGK